MSGMIAAKIPFPSFNATFLLFAPLFIMARFTSMFIIIIIIWSNAMLDVAVYFICFDGRFRGGCLNKHGGVYPPQGAPRRVLYKTYIVGL